MKFNSTNPYNGTILNVYEKHQNFEVQEALTNANQDFEHWKKTSMKVRAGLMLKAAELLRTNVEVYANSITLEMGKPIKESRAEIEKCAWVCEYYAQNAADFLAEKRIETDATESFITYAPLGLVFAIMPWNFPFWQVFRFAAPTLMAGNVGLLKHASNVPACALHIENIFLQAGFPKGVFQNLFIGHDEVKNLLENDLVKAVSLTGSEKAGASVASIAGKNIKKSLLELGGSNAFIVFADADLDEAVKLAVKSRMLNTGQSCIAAKRFIIMEGIHDEFVKKFSIAIRNLKIGNPLEEDTEIGPLSSEKQASDLMLQISKSIEMGAEIIVGGNRNAAYFEPTLLTNVQPGMPVFDEETFGPVAAIIKVETEEDAFLMANHPYFGLGITLCTQNIEKAKKFINLVDDGCFFINELVKSDPRLPFGGTKHSGYGRELSKEGMLEFVNTKTIYIK
jgi:succinate-semialdehyde dehydrogenase / glutarate-semialdehyde dehydrogenase